MKDPRQGVTIAPVTPLETYPKLAAAIGVPHLYFKREDLHPYGSHKGRSIPVMIDTYVGKADPSKSRRFAISSSGNAALAAALYVHELNGRKTASGASGDLIDLDIFIGQHAAPHKAERLKSLADGHIRILLKERPLQALSEAVNEGAQSLRQSTNDIALVGYGSLAQELADESNTRAKLKSADKTPNKGVSIFIGTSSGTTAQALAKSFVDRKLTIQVHIVQTSSCHPLADAFESYDGPDEASIADAIVDIAALRKDALVPLIKKTGGRAWVATNDDILAAQEFSLKQTGLEISTNSALSVAGAMKAVELGYEVGDTIICMITGE